MKPAALFAVVAVWCGALTTPPAGAEFSVAEYQHFLQGSRDMASAEQLERHPPLNPYYQGRAEGMTVDQVSYLDSTIMKYGLTEAELELLSLNQFVVTERLSYDCFGAALHDVYGKDLPVFVSTDAILHTLHASYDRLLWELEMAVLKPKLTELLDGLHAGYPVLLDRHGANPGLQEALADVDLYLTIARSLLAEEKLPPQRAEPAQVDALWEAIQAESVTSMPLFTRPDRLRKLDFSQFTVRGHYTQQHWDGTRPLAAYFKCMMWLGRMEFLLTPPDEAGAPPWGREEIRRMNLDAVLLHELVELAEGWPLLDEIDTIITFMVGESDNLTPPELSGLIEAQGIARADDLLDEVTFDGFLEALEASGQADQKILSTILIKDPSDPEPMDLPASFRLMGQRFIIDSYVFSNVVYDRVPARRMMPDPLDAAFAWGNDDALPLLREGLERYHYSPQLEALRYLVDAHDTDFWNASLYNVWLQAIRRLNPPADRTGYPFFMQTAAWQQEKLNTQLASWAQLRHDNLLYAKQSYTAGTVCSFPHSFVEPYPAFYRQIGAFAEKAEPFFADLGSGDWQSHNLRSYFSRVRATMSKLEGIAQKELDRQPLSPEEEEFLQRMLFIEGGSGAPPFSGWYAELFYDQEESAKTDFVVADVHTQPTDEMGGLVGKVLHVGVGQVNLGIFLAGSPSCDFQPTAFVGPVMSYYEKVTEDFDRLTDERWTEMVRSGDLPARPDWVNIYLVDGKGGELAAGRELAAVPYPTAVAEETSALPKSFGLAQNHPNPFNAETVIRFSLPTSSHTELAVYNLGGQRVATLAWGWREAGSHTVHWDGRDDEGRRLASGAYLYRLTGAGGQEAGDPPALTRAMVLLK